MASIERRSGRYRVKYRDPIGRQRSRTFTRKADADRFAVEMEADLARGQWLGPAGAQLPVAEWAETFLSLCRRLEYTSRAAYERDLRRYVVPRFGDYRIGSLRVDRPTPRRRTPPTGPAPLRTRRQERSWRAQSANDSRTSGGLAPTSANTTSGYRAIDSSISAKTWSSKPSSISRARESSSSLV